jgi:hypothetical protein
MRRFNTWFWIWLIAFFAINGAEEWARVNGRTTLEHALIVLLTLLFFVGIGGWVDRRWRVWRSQFRRLRSWFSGTTNSN